MEDSYCRVTVQKTGAAYNELGSAAHGRGSIFNAPGKHRAERDEKVAKLVEPICKDRPRVVLVEVLGEEGKVQSSFKVYMHHGTYHYVFH